jgi:hypothetical protein
MHMRPAKGALGISPAVVAAITAIEAPSGKAAPTKAAPTKAAAMLRFSSFFLINQINPGFRPAFGRTFLLLVCFKFKKNLEKLPADEKTLVF